MRARDCRSLNFLFASALLAVTSGCSAEKKEEVIVEYYQPAYRQLPPEPVYSRVTWTHLPQPIKPRSRDNAPLLMPTLAFELPRSTLGEAIQALAQALGYNWSYPQEAAGRKIAIKMTASVDEIVRELDRQAGVRTVLDNESRMVRVVTPAMIDPSFGAPEAKLPGAGS